MPTLFSISAKDERRGHCTTEYFCLLACFGEILRICTENFRIECILKKLLVFTFTYTLIKKLNFIV